MTNTSATPTPAVPATPILVNATPTPDQIASAIRYGVTAAGSIAGALGYSGVFSDKQDNTAAAMIGPMAVVIAFIWGQLVTRLRAKQLAVTAAHSPDPVAQVKP
jgi:uncharacterized membrane protein YfcA